MAGRFEAHITFDRLSDWRVKCLPDTFTGFSFSAIDGDPVMGKKAYCYLTAYDSSSENLLSRVKRVAKYAQSVGVVPLREKIEEIIYDSRTGYQRV